MGFSQHFQTNPYPLVPSPRLPPSQRRAGREKVCSCRISPPLEASKLRCTWWSTALGAAWSVPFQGTRLHGLVFTFALSIYVYIYILIYIYIYVYFDILYPICSMYGILTYIYPTNGPNVGKYTIHGASGYVDFMFQLSCGEFSLASHWVATWPLPRNSSTGVWMECNKWSSKMERMQLCLLSAAQESWERSWAHPGLKWLAMIRRLSEHTKIPEIP